MQGHFLCRHPSPNLILNTSQRHSLRQAQSEVQSSRKEMVRTILCPKVDAHLEQGKAKKTRKFAQVKRLLNPNDARLWVLNGCSICLQISWRCHLEERKTSLSRSRRKRRSVKRRYIERMNNQLLLCSHIWLIYFPYSPQVPSALFLQHNTALAPPYRVLIDTNFINFSLQNKLELISGMMDCLYAKCTSGLHMPCPFLHSPTPTD